MKLQFALLVAAASVAACGAGSANAPAKPSAPPGPVTRYQNTLPGQTIGAPVDLIQTIVDFAPNAASAVHIHPAPNLATVLQGQITVKAITGDVVASAGKAIVEPVNQPVQAINSSAGESMVAVAFTVPHGGKPTVPVAGQPAPATPNKTLYTFTFDSPSISGSYRIVQQVLDFAAGSQTPRQRHGGPGVITVLQGQLALDGAEQTYNAGDSLTETPGETLQAFNRGSSGLVVVATYLVPDGAQPTTNL
jgi:quercetin dioxygenase-like cupin family protein